MVGWRQHPTALARKMNEWLPLHQHCCAANVLNYASDNL